ncbi:tRNA (adenosine(37)-N6)-dimethylallyltransferase MiaA [Thalassococcus sp. S3]|uniref:tRNA (adenosine(37)-N6)-dimethylallyltransferase MiaA n=1 Tax=Thalassococcus sp. S3 TaxID=2017482 RepID=UPI00102456AD|nr:tRNA (adenosine(37)-N6)-dimethylallyltransferase MiaA [Thalassococcus sp. S3]QBF31679.1 tRNA (adenosine(37)-N6)-dimethylallyltransferase MiaA [Thalassococcus sp. S3]
MTLYPDLPDIPEDRPVLIAGATASGKSALALEIAQRHGGVIVNADASQVYDCWRIVTARPSQEDEGLVPHLLYGHVPWRLTYSAGQWLTDVKPLLTRRERPIIVGGTGLYFSALTQGMVDLPPIAPETRQRADAMSSPDLLARLDPKTRSAIDTENRARVQRAWEVLEQTGRGLADWQAETPAPALELTACVPIALDTPRDWLEARIFKRFDQMIAGGALEEVENMRSHFDPSLPAFKAIGVPELMAHLDGAISLEAARERASIATRQFAKRQRTWMRSKMRQWFAVEPAI